MAHGFPIVDSVGSTPRRKLRNSELDQERERSGVEDQQDDVDRRFFPA